MVFAGIRSSPAIAGPPVQQAKRKTRGHYCGEVTAGVVSSLSAFLAKDACEAGLESTKMTVPSCFSRTGVPTSHVAFDSVAVSCRCDPPDRPGCVGPGP